MKRLVSLLLALSLLVVAAPRARAAAPDASTLLQAVVSAATAKPDAAIQGVWSVTTDGQESAQTYVNVQTSGGDRLLSISPDAQQWTVQAAIKGGELFVSDPAAGWQDAGAYPLTQADSAIASSAANRALDFLGLAEQAAHLAPSADVIGSEQLDGVDTTRIRIQPDAAKLNDLFHRTAGGKSFNPQVDAYMVDASSFSYWVDGSGVVRKGSFLVHLLASTKGDKGQETHDVSYRATYTITPGAQSITWPALPAPGTAPAPVPAPAPASGGNAKYTVMVFMNGTDLESKGANATKDLQEMQVVGSNSDINVVVETLGTKAWQTPNISNQTNQRWRVTKGGLELVADNLGVKPVGDPATLTEFITWAQQKYPADKYALVFWDHGGGPNAGFGFDELATPSSLGLNGIQKAISDATTHTGHKFELIGFDACLMGGIETAAMLSPYSKYLVASEEVEPGHGWWYTHILQALENNPTMGGDQLGRAIVDSFKAQASSPAWQDVAEITLAVTDLSKVDNVVAKLETLVTAAGPDVGDVSRLQPMLKARSKAEDYGNGHDALDLADLGDLAQGLAANYGDAATVLQQAIQDAVIYKLTTAGKPRQSGLSVFFPYKNKDEMAGRVATYNDLAFSPAYRQFIGRYAATYAQDTAKVDFAQAAPSGDGRSLSVQVKPDEANQIDQIYSVVAKAKDGDPGTLLFLGMDNDVQVDAKTGTVQSDFTAQSVTLNGHFVSMFYEGDAGDTADYRIPIKLNGQQVDLQVLFNYKTGKSQVIGAWPGIDPVAHQPAKELIKLKSGDRITPLFYWVNTKTDKDGYEAGPEFVLKGPARLYWADMPAGDYLYGYYVMDTAQNDSFSDFSTVHADGPTTPNAIKVVVDEQQLSLDVPPEVRGGRTMVPLRAIFDALGAKINWDNSTHTVTATREGTTISLQIDNPVAQVNGKNKTLDQAPMISGGRTLVPLRFISEALGAQVIWDAETHTAIIVSQP